MMNYKIQIKSLLEKWLREIFKKDYLVGLDIGTSSIKLTQFLRKEDGLHLTQLGLEELKFATDEESRQKEILSALKKLLSEIDMERSKFMVSINCPKTAVRRITAPYMPRQELKEAIRLEAKNYFPFPVDEVLIDFQIGEEILEKGVKKYQVLVSASPKETIDKYLSLLGKVGIKPDAFIPIPYALQKLHEVSHPQGERINCFLDLGAHYTELIIFKGKSLIFSRKIPIAGNDFTQAMTGIIVSDAGRIELSFDEAEKIKREVGMPAETESKLINNKISTTQILSRIRQPVEQLVNEVARCFDYYREETIGERINSLVLFGQGSSLKGLPGFIFQRLGIEARIGDPSEFIKIEPKLKEGMEKSPELLPCFAVAMGLALSEARGINLLPVEIKEEMKRTIMRTTFEIVGAVVILILVFIYAGMRIQLSGLQKKISVARTELAVLEPQLKQAELQNLAGKVLRDEPYWEDIFKELSNIIPPDIYLTEFSLENKALKMQGMVTAKAPQESLSNFIIILENGIFKDVRLVTTKQMKGKPANEFEIECRVE